MTEPAPAGSIALERQGAVALARLHAPPLNLLGRPMKEALADTMQALAADATVRAIVLAGAGGRHFCAGADLKEFPDRIERGTAPSAAREGQRLAASILFSPKPTLAAIVGACLGGGCELATFCDFRVAAPDAQLGFPEITRGVFPGNGGAQVLPRLVGPARAKRLMLSGATVSGEEAFGFGLVDRLAPSGAVEDVALAWAAELAERPAVAVREIKDLVDGPERAELERRWAAEAEAFGRVFATEDVKEGVAAFFEKRPPRFRHR